MLDDGSWNVSVDFAVVQFGDGKEAVAGAGHEGFVGGIGVVELDVIEYDGDAKLVGQCQNGPFGRLLEARCGPRRS